MAPGIEAPAATTCKEKSPDAHSADKLAISLGWLIKTSAIARASARKRLWLGAAGIALFLATVSAAYIFRPQPPQGPRSVGLDFIAFYTAGTFVREGHLKRLYDLQAVQQFQHDLARRLGVEIGSACGPWWNPPFYALVFAPLSRLPYPNALAVWLTINLLCAAIAVVLLVRMLPVGTPWQTRALVPILLILSTPFIHALSHAQNTCTSLLLLTITVWLSRSRRPLLAGVVGGLLFYKPQLAMIVAAVLILDLGWRAAAGYAITGLGLLAVTVLILPGTLAAFVHRVPANLDFVQSHSVYLWERHATFKAFWRLLLQGRGVAHPSVATVALTAASMSIAGLGLLWAAVCARSRGGVWRDRLIAAAIAATPLLVPFYFDYDQLLLAIPVVLFAAELMTRQGKPMPRADRWLVALWSVYFVWLMLNPDVAEKTRVNLTVPLLAGIVSLLIARAIRVEARPPRGTGVSPVPSRVPPAKARFASAFQPIRTGETSVPQGRASVR